MELQVPDASNKSFSTFDLFFRSSCPFSDDTALGHLIGVVPGSMRGDDMLELTKRFAKCDAGAISLEHSVIAAGIAAAVIIAVGSHGAQVRPAFAKMRLQLAIQASALSSGRPFRMANLNIRTVLGHLSRPSHSCRLPLGTGCLMSPEAPGEPGDALVDAALPPDELT
jgi:Flp pilus assembly pilin Flp